MTIVQALNVQHRSVSYRDAEVLLATVLKVERAYLHTHPDIALNSQEQEAFESFLRRREQNEPVAYITGHKEFFGRMFKIDNRALIPRPETEGLVERALEWAVPYFKEHTAASGTPCPLCILELGTGAGPIGVSLALELVERAIPATLMCTEIDEPALALAEENWRALSEGKATGNIVMSFILADLFEHEKISKRPFNLIIANLPYVETTWQVGTGAQPDVVFFEPDVALFGGQDGLEMYRRFFSEAPKHLEKAGAVMVEYGETQTAVISRLATAAFPDKKMTIHQDYAGLDRILTLV